MAGGPTSRFQAAGKMTKISTPAHDELTEVKEHLETARGRQVTYSETVEYLISYWKSGLAVTAAKEAAR